MMQVSARAEMNRPDGGAIGPVRSHVFQAPF